MSLPATSAKPWPQFEEHRAALERRFQGVGDFKPEPFLLAELTLMNYLGALYNKYKWHEKILKAEIQSKWEAELRTEVVKGTQKEKLLNYALAEAKARAESLSDDSKVGPAGVVFTFQSDGTVDKEVLAQLKQYSCQLSSVPNNKKDWHPNSNNTVLDLVHPSLYCLVYGRTTSIVPADHALIPDTIPPLHIPQAQKKESLGPSSPSTTDTDSLSPSGDGWPSGFLPCTVGAPCQTKHPVSAYTVQHPIQSFFLKKESKEPRVDENVVSLAAPSTAISTKFQWLPAEFDCDTESKCEILSYINNLHPVKYSGLYNVIEKIFGSVFVPLFSEVLSDGLFPSDRRLEMDCNWYESEKEKDDEEGSDDDDYDYFERRTLKEVVIPDFEGLPIRTSTLDLKGKRLQVAALRVIDTTHLANALGDCEDG
eukprot:GHVN01037327.1.p1 GENE.GHVN01037327.1~~GHVN01037327.1.p1  ORF type:complete len:424 (+),score=44.44 GHVN01037327.1:45-1316(+)